MYLKMTGAILIVAAAYLYGKEISLQYRDRVYYLEELLLALEFFTAEVGYGLTPLPQAFENIGKRVKSPVKGLFRDTASELRKGSGLSARECWQAALENNSLYRQLTEEQLELLQRLGTVWGKGDKNAQLKQVLLLQELLRQALQTAREQQQKNEKLWRYLGLLGGVTLVIFLL